MIRIDTRSVSQRKRDFSLNAGKIVPVEMSVCCFASDP